MSNQAKESQLEKRTHWGWISKVMKLMPGITGFCGATSMERLPVEWAIKAQVEKFRAMKLAG